MKRVKLFFITALLLLLTSVTFIHCGGGGGGGNNVQPQMQPPASNLTGTWSWSGYVASTSCASASVTPWAGVVTHSPGSNYFTITSTTTGVNIISAQGTISGNSISLSASYPDNGGTSNFSYTGTLDSTNMIIDGTSTWNWNGNPACSGTSHISATCTTCSSGGSTYTVTYDGNGNTGGSSPVDTTHYQSADTVTVLGNTGNLVRTGYSFAGWNTLANGSGTTYAQGQTFTIGSANVILYAMWTASPTYTVTYNGNGNTGGSAPVDTTHYQSGQTFTVLGNTGNLARTGYSFTGWNTLANGSGTTYTQGLNVTMGSANVTLYAKWASVPTHTVTYNGNGNTGGSAPADSTNYQSGQTVTVLGNTGNLVKIGYSFAGWNTLANGSGTTYTQGQTFTMGSANVTLYAKWTLAYTVTYNGNHYTGGAVPVDSNNYTQGQTVTVRGNTGNLVNSPFTFAGWNTQANGSGTTYTQGQTFTMGSANVTLYAQWNCLTYSPAGAYTTEMVALAGCNIKFVEAQNLIAPMLITPNQDCALHLADNQLWITQGGLYGTVVWQDVFNACQSSGGCYWTFQSDGNLVVYNPNNNPVWASNTSGHPGAVLYMSPGINTSGQTSCRITIFDNNTLLFIVP